MKFINPSRCWLVLILLLSPFSPAQSSENAPLRLVTLGGTVTETVYALGAGQQVVATDTSSVWPPAVHALPKVGYYRELAAEGILSAAPDLVLASAHAGPPAVLQKLRSAGIKLVVLPEPPPLAEALAMISSIAQALGKDAEARALIKSIEESIKALPPAPQHKPGALVVIGGQGGQWMAAGRDSAAGALVTLAGARNVASSFSGYRPVGDEAIISLAPDIIIVPQHALPMLGGRQGILQRPSVAATPAGQKQQVLVMDSLMILAMGPRVGTAAQLLSQHFIGLQTDSGS
ncbi:MAG: hemin ABC transporter substrate-binding protein [Oceanococcus sp.]|nr:MAG: hemin ABC transporter substrate-binding protein [Oceanococcus sp.]